MKISSNTFMLYMSAEDFYNTNIDKIFDPHCRTGFVYILKGDETPEIFNQKLSDAEKELEYWKRLAAHRLKGVLYWRNRADKYLINRGINDLFKHMYANTALLDRVKKSYEFYGSKMDVPFNTRHIQKEIK